MRGSVHSPLRSWNFFVVYALPVIVIGYGTDREQSWLGRYSVNVRKL